MTPIFLDQCPQKNLMQENWCNYLRVFLLSNIKVQSGCRNWPTQQRISLAVIPHSLREISWLKPWKTLSAVPQYETAPTTLASAQTGLRQPLSVSRWTCVSLSWPASAPGGSMSALGASASATLTPMVLCATLGCLCVSYAGPSDALRSTWLPLRGLA